MKITIKYESDKLLPEEIELAISKMKKYIKENKYEADKIECDIMNMRGKIIRWIDSNCEIIKK